MKANIPRRLARRQRRIERRLSQAKVGDGGRPVLAAGSIQYEVAGRACGTVHGGIGAIHALARRIGLADAIDERLHVLKIHRPYHESDHVLNLAYNALCGGGCLQDIERRRGDEAFLDALGARRIPDPTTAGDFCRRFAPADVMALQAAFDEVRVGVWAGQPAGFFERATIDMDGALVPTAGECKQGVDVAYDGTWGYHALVLSLAETGEVLRVVNRPGSRPSHEGAAEQVDQCLATCFRGGFRRVRLRGDTDFSQTAHLDRWSADRRVTFVFGYDARQNLVDLAEGLPERAWRALERPARPAAAEPRARPERVKEQVVVARGFENQRLRAESVAEFNYRPTACGETYRMVVVRKNVSVTKGEQALFDRLKYFFYITNEWAPEPAEIVAAANGRCHQENLLAQLLGGVRALAAPVGTLAGNWAYMVMTALAWNLKAWWALTLPEEPGRWQGRRRAEKRWVLGIEFATFAQAFVRLPCQVLRTGRRLVCRLLGWNPHLPIFFRLVAALRC